MDYILQRYGSIKAIENYAKKKITLYKERDEVKRSAFKERISSINTSTIVYIDESGVDNRIFRAYGRAPRGEKVYGNINGSSSDISHY
ncbi:hypothetical protein [Candidatus Lariskella endosymbiont of Hedychridium roseum]|uniref:hypothetical protein n=1 Tax=Candidatus Lariskella endosymbiont of Hedychridium roseum TaxID=3077949 RepID=UPI0030CFA578